MENKHRDTDLSFLDDLIQEENSSKAHSADKTPVKEVGAKEVIQVEQDQRLAVRNEKTAPSPVLYQESYFYSVDKPSDITFSSYQYEGSARAESKTKDSKTTDKFQQRDSSENVKKRNYSSLKFGKRWTDNEGVLKSRFDRLAPGKDVNSNFFKSEQARESKLALELDELSRLRRAKEKEVIIRLVLDNWVPEDHPSACDSDLVESFKAKERVIKSLMSDWKV